MDIEPIIRLPKTFKLAKRHVMPITNHSPTAHSCGGGVGILYLSGTPEWPVSGLVVLLLLLIDGSGERRPEPRHGRVSRGVTPDDSGLAHPGIRDMR